MPYATTTFAQFRQELANRLNDPNKVFWTDAELKVHIQNAMRFWNALTGDNKQWYSLSVTGTPVVWYDLHVISGSPRQCSLQDLDVYSWLQYALIEPQLSNAALGTAQYSTDDLIESLQRARDEFLFRTGCTSTVYPLVVTPNVADLTVRETVIAVRRGYWFPAAPFGPIQPGPIFRSDAFASTAYAPAAPSSPANPQVFSPGFEPPLTVTLTPPPSAPGKVEFITVESQAQLSNPPPPGTTLFMPSDFVPALYWRTLADLLDMNAEARDSERAKYARQRYEQFVELLPAYPCVVLAQFNGAQAFVSAVESLDSYSPSWETSSATPATVAVSGQNLVAIPSPSGIQANLYVVANANLPVADNDFIQLGREVQDCILDYAQHTAAWKQGWYEFSLTMPLFKSIVEMAAKRNAKVRAMSTFRDILYGGATLEDERTPYEMAANTEAEETV